MKRTIKLNESELKRMIAESVRKQLNEMYMDGQYEQIDLDGSVTDEDLYAANL